jgi:hypothetical protein
MAPVEIIGMVLLALGGWLVWDSLRARETANAQMRATCRAEGLLFLDDTVALHSVWPVRDTEGRLKLRRIYGFEYSDTGHDRRKGTLTLIGGNVHSLDLGLTGRDGGVLS